MRKKINKVNKIKRKKLLLFIRFIFVMISIFCIIFILKWCKDNAENKKELSNINEAISINDNNNIDKYNIDFDKLKKINSDTVGWIKMNGTNIEYPVVKSNDNSYYLNHNFEKKVNSAGWIFANCNCIANGEDKNLVIFGHNRKDKSMFGSLKNVLDEKWYDEENNKYIIYKTENENSIYEIFSVYVIKAEEYYMKNDFSNLDEFNKFINILKNRSKYVISNAVNQNDKILTLSTCYDNFDLRLVVHAKKIDAKWLT